MTRKRSSRWKKGAFTSTGGKRLKQSDPFLNPVQDAETSMTGRMENQNRRVQGQVEAMEGTFGACPIRNEEGTSQFGQESEVIGEQDEEEFQGPMLPPIQQEISHQSLPGIEHSLAPKPMKLCWTTLLCLLAKTGGMKYTDSQYDLLCSVLNYQSRDEDVLPSRTTVKRSIIPSLLIHAAVKSHILILKVNLAKRGAAGGVGIHKSADAAPVRVVYPTSWAKADVQISGILRGFRTRSVETVDREPGPCFSGIEESPIVIDRESVVLKPLIGNKRGGTTCLQVGTKVQVTMASTDALQRFLCQAFFNPVMNTSTLAFEGICEKLFFPTLQDVDVDVTNKRKGSRSSNQNFAAVFRSGDIVVKLVSTSATEMLNEGRRDREVSVPTFFIVFRAWIRNNRMKGDFRVSMICCPNGHEWGDETPNEPVLRRRVDKVVALDGSIFPGLRDVDSSVATSGVSGHLQDGRRYYVYRFFLYEDGFNAYAGEPKSVTGCYMLPLGIDLLKVSLSSAVRKISLSPPGISGNDVFRKIVDDIVSGTVHGVETRDEEGELVTVFLDCVGLLGDYPAVSECLDVMGHTANAPCSLCSFQRYDVSGRGGCRYAYSSEMSSAHPSFCRSSRRTSTLRMSDISDKELHSMGMRTSRGGESGGCERMALDMLSERLEMERHKIPFTSDGNRVVPGIFDMYRCSIVAPDHLFFGIGSTLMGACLRVLPKPLRKQADALAVRILEEEYLESQKSVFDAERMLVYAMKMSQLYSLLLVAPYAFKAVWSSRRRGGYICSAEEEEQFNDHLELLNLFQTLVSTTQFAPSLLVDGVEDIRWYNDGNGGERLLELKNKAEHFLSKLNELCLKHPESKKELDKPNIHRLLEFYTYTLPCFGNVQIIQELLLERAHQELKRGLARSNFKNEQLQSMKDMLSNDWFERLGFILEQEKNDVTSWSELSVRKILRHFGRKEWSQPVLDAGVVERVKSIFSRPPIIQAIRRRRSTIHSFSHREYVWKTIRDNIRRSRGQEDESSLVRRSAMDSYEYLSGYLRSMHEGNVEVQEYGCADWVVMYGRESSFVQKLMSIKAGDVVQSVCILDESHSFRDTRIFAEPEIEFRTRGSKQYWAVVGIFRAVVTRSDGSTKVSHYVGAFHCSKDRQGLFCRVNGRKVQLVSLSSNVRRVMIKHNYSVGRSDGNECSCLGGETSCPSILEEGRYVYWDRSKGYPPRRG